MKVFRMSARARQELRDYYADLLTRVRRVRCPVCNAAPKKHCRRNDGAIKESCHQKRHVEAKFAGLVAGLTIKQRRQREHEHAERKEQRRLARLTKESGVT